MTNYFHPDKIMLQILEEGLRYHAGLDVPAKKQIDQQAYHQHIENTETDPKLLVAAAFRDNKRDVLPKAIKRYQQQITLRSVIFNNRAFRKFEKEKSNIVKFAPRENFVKNNIGGKTGDAPSVQEVFASDVVVMKAQPISEGNVAYMDGWREKLRNTA